MNTFTKAVVSATGGGLLPPSNPPTVPFKLTPIVQQYAAAMAMKISGLPPRGDSDETPPSTSHEALSQSQQMPPSISHEALSQLQHEATDSMPSTDAIASEEEYDRSASTTPAATMSSTTTPTQFFSPVQQQRNREQRKRAASVGVCGGSARQRNMSDDSSSSSTQQQYFQKKTTLVVAKTARRAELHALAVAIKKQELAFWKTATEKLQRNEVRIGDILPMNAVQTQQPLLPTSQYVGHRIANDFWAPRIVVCNVRTTTTLLGATTSRNCIEHSI